ncbi:hypothetical protein TNCV_577051 [Trichonephila clavipes]|nr:hypothetical protein TNCV_577051 [Trichonephila clavipes]
MFKNCRKEDLRIVALELGETVAEKVTIAESTEIIKENKYFKEDVEFVKELIQYTIEDRKRVEEDVKKKRKIAPTITEDLVPTTKIDFNLNNIPNLKLADKNFNIPERVQMRAEVFYELMLPGQFKTESSNVIFQNTVFGIVVSGSTSSDAKGKEHCGFIQAADNLGIQLRSFGKSKM